MKITKWVWVLLLAATSVSAQEPVNGTKLRVQVEDIRATDVAWRKIEWKTCLLEGLRQSREQRKPIVLWIFIDRPIDDERC